MDSFDLHWISKPLLHTMLFWQPLFLDILYQLSWVSLLHQASARTRKSKRVPFENTIKVINCIQVTEEDTNNENECSADNILHLLSDKLFNTVVWVPTSLTQLLQFPPPKFHILHFKTVADTGQRISLQGLRLFTRQKYHLGLLDCYRKHPLDVKESAYHCFQHSQSPLLHFPELPLY